MDCRSQCGACCIAPSITSPLPGMPAGKPAGVPCVNLTEDFQCALFDDPRRPDFCANLQPNREMCGENRDQAIRFLDSLDQLTR